MAGGPLLGGYPCLGVAVGSWIAGPAHLKIHLDFSGIVLLGTRMGMDSLLSASRFEVVSLMWHLQSFLVGGFLSNGG